MEPHSLFWDWLFRLQAREHVVVSETVVAAVAQGVLGSRNQERAVLSVLSRLHMFDLAFHKRRLLLLATGHRPFQLSRTQEDVLLPLCASLYRLLGAMDAFLPYSYVLERLCFVCACRTGNHSWYDLFDQLKVKRRRHYEEYDVTWELCCDTLDWGFPAIA